MPGLRPGFAQMQTAARYVCYGGLKLDTVSFIGYVGGRDILLTQKEFAVLLLLTQNAEHKVS